MQRSMFVRHIAGDFLRETDENEATLDLNSRPWKLHVSIGEKVACKACEPCLELQGVREVVAGRIENRGTAAFTGAKGLTAKIPPVS